MATHLNNLYFSVGNILFLSTESFFSVFQEFGLRSHILHELLISKTFTAVVSLYVVRQFLHHPAKEPERSNEPSRRR